MEMFTMGTLVSYELKDSIASIAMDDGKVNVLSLEMQTELNKALDRAVEDQAVTLITGRPGVFSAGFHLPTLQSGGPKALKMLIGGFELAYRLLSFPTPVVMACSGHAIAMAAFLVLCGDYRIGANGPYKLTANEVAIGLTVPRAAIEICRAKLTPSHFNRSVLNAEIFTPADSIPAGFLDRVVPEDKILNEARIKAIEYSKLDMPAYRQTKALVREKLLIDLRAAIEYDRADFREIFK
jgi:enoyl-CoA hydratase